MVTHPRFWKAFERLPATVQKLAREKHALWKDDPFHASLRFEERRNSICVVRIGEHYRALGLREGEVIAWFWIGTHEEYNLSILILIASSVWTQNLGRAHRVAEQIHTGTVWVNCWLLRDLRVPFGGMKQSGVGREGGNEALHFFTEPKHVCIAR